MKKLIFYVAIALATIWSPTQIYASPKSESDSSSEAIPDPNTWVALNRVGWTVTGCSQRGDKDRETNNFFYFAHVKDGDTSTYWCTDWASGDEDSAPHFLVIDLGEGEHAYDGFGYLPMQMTQSGGNGYCNNYAVYVSNDISTILTDGGTYLNGYNPAAHSSIKTYMVSNTPDAIGTMNYTSSNTNRPETRVHFTETKTERYVIFVFKSTANVDTKTVHANCAEFNLYAFRGSEVKPDPTPGPNYTTGLEEVYNTRTDNRRTSALKIADNAGHSSSVTKLQTTETKSPMYFDRTQSVTMTTTPGAVITIFHEGLMAWMHQYIYVDWDKNGFLYESPNTYFGSNGYNIQPGADLVCFDFFSRDGSNSGYDSYGNSVKNNIRTQPLSFAVPKDIKPGTYRVRYKIDWNNLDPKGDQSYTHDGRLTIVANGGIIVDFAIEIKNNEADALNELNTEPAIDTEWYTLQGMRIATPTKGGIYLRATSTGVKKVLIR